MSGVSEGQEAPRFALEVSSLRHWDRVTFYTDLPIEEQDAAWIGQLRDELQEQLIGLGQCTSKLNAEGRLNRDRWERRVMLQGSAGRNIVRSGGFAGNMTRSYC
ncbi:unnamed protein product [Fusarium fujikuroi]|uniref:Uncharacterized protein n=1 Tax=Fusarium fujikuroi TaxID=5127 RepID=A0A9Q9S4N3_FUSFU|nr:unnamed protein product [Fusarium fujikuroi]VTT83005.1 unnamed protein product [Fusarium fujikuroi]VZH92673.1 unnamed protein product [Fusarium fujikuroi]